MCGRFSLTISWTELCHRYGLVLPLPLEGTHRYNIAPGQNCLVMTQRETLPSLELMKWGLVPHWSKDPKSGYRLINARAETLHQKPSFRECFQRKRCLVPTDGFYEWVKENDQKLPMRIIMRDASVFSLAGLWDRWLCPETGNSLHTFTIVTTKSNDAIAPIHDRMPVILNPSTEKIWLDLHTSSKDLQELFVPYSSELMHIYPVSAAMNSSKVDDPSCIAPRAAG